MTHLDRRSFLATTAGAALAAATPALAQGSEDARLRAQLDAMFETLVDESPRLATSLGLDKDRRAPLKSQLDDNSLAAKARRLQRSRDWVKSLGTIDRSRLSPGARIDLDTVLYAEERTVYSGDRYKFGDVGRNYSPYVVSQRTGAYQSIPDFLDSQHTVDTREDAEAYLARLEAFAANMDAEVERVRRHVGLGVVPPDFAIDGALAGMKVLRQPADASTLVTSLAGKATAKGLAGDWQAAAAKVYDGKVVPALDRQMALLESLRPRATVAGSSPCGAPPRRRTP